MEGANGEAMNPGWRSRSNATKGLANVNELKPESSYRWYLGLSRKGLARILGTDPNNLAAWETGKHRPTRKSLALVTELLCVGRRLTGNDACL